MSPQNNANELITRGKQRNKQIKIYCIVSMKEKYLYSKQMIRVTDKDGFSEKKRTRENERERDGEEAKQSNSFFCLSCIIDRLHRIHVFINSASNFSYSLSESMTSLSCCLFFASRQN